MQKWTKWRDYWWQLLMLEDNGYGGWQPMRAARPLLKVPNAAMAVMSLEEWAAAMVEDAADSFSEFDGEVRVDCFTVPDPGPDDVPVVSKQTRIYDE
ncbi:hypothetical protein [Crossiella cryophila]|uniref:Uncharacterized protein n=1 Tax=Crossiella cryophila TaxID=43355 RepID=A0A7W7FW45_9PSEU|nr:hypothetical protein [Crossiella cryophila]MBB4679208.1 hypothetical protein [Crossiella cryophila]